MALEGGTVSGVLSAAHREMQQKQQRGAAASSTTDVIDGEGYFTSLPRDYYFSQDRFDEEMRRVFSRQWLYAGQLSQVKQPGDYYVRQIGPESLIITRDNDGKLRAFFNVCRHRGSELCANDTAGRTKLFVCPYHQ